MWLFTAVSQHSTLESCDEFSMFPGGLIGGADVANLQVSARSRKSVKISDRMNAVCWDIGGFDVHSFRSSMVVFVGLCKGG